ncbi:capsular polysaccharide biosynthesis protein [Aestuariibius sp. HNIBRBA575]|uniref:capsular polysaccharide biosynthesis protein n=1 Tax=Aestuariibius sp. HNIBRBA575 TaxID=3233343 RepID=UPI0034A326E5
MPAAQPPAQRLFVYNGGFLTQRRMRRILELSGYDIRLGKPGDDDLIGVWGQSPTAPRGEAVAAHTGSKILRVEDAFLRSVYPGRSGEPPIGLHLDRKGVHFDPAQPSDLEDILAHDPLDDTALLNRARAAMERLKSAHLSKYNAFDPAAPVPAPGYVLVIDQTRGDASLKASRANRDSFYEMLYYAQEEHPGARIVIKTHPESENGHRPGHYRPEDASGRVSLSSDAVSPYALFDGAIAVYTVSSQMGFEAIIAGHKPVVFGQPFYMGWGLTDDRMPLDRRQRNLSRAQLFAAAMILYPRWYDPYCDRLCSLEQAISTLEAETRAWREDHQGWVATGMRMWKRKPMQAVFGQYQKMRFVDPPNRAIGKAQDQSRRLMVWSNKETPELAQSGAVRVEDGFLRSKGLGAQLVPPLSLVCDDLGIYYDPTRESRLERLINQSDGLSQDALDRAETLIKTLTKSGLSKYNLDGADLPSGLPAGRCILVPGQVEDDASIQLGTTQIYTNRALLQATRQANPAAIILFKPHPDVEAGLRKGAIDDADQLADAILTKTDAMAALHRVDEVWTMTSLMGFEALLRGKRVTCFGTPFYAGWGLTDDQAPSLPRRSARPTLAGLVHAVLIAYPRYYDPITQRPCPVEVVVDRLIDGTLPKTGRLNRSLSKLQGLFASYAHLWR